MLFRLHFGFQVEAPQLLTAAHAEASHLRNLVTSFGKFMVLLGAQ